MRNKTLVLFPLVAVLTALSVYLPASQKQTSANAPQYITGQGSVVTEANRIEDYLSIRNKQSASRSAARISFGKKIIKSGKQYFGTPYCHGGTTPRCFDCSGFIKYVYGRNGINLPRMADDQMRTMEIIPKSEAQEGDLVFFVTSSGYAYHVGIYVGNNTILHSPKPRRSVKLERIWSSRVVYARESLQ